MSAPIPWGRLEFMWCRLVHRNGEWSDAPSGSHYRCRTCWKGHYLKEAKP